MFTIIESLIQ